MAQYLRPDADVSAGLWDVTPLWSKIDEATASDSDFIDSDKSGTSHCEVSLTNPSATPASGTCTVRWRGRRKLTNKNNTVVCRLMEGTTEHASQTQANPSSVYTTWSFTFNHGDVTNWNDLRLRFDCTVQGGVEFEVSWAEVEVPDPPSFDSEVAEAASVRIALPGEVSEAASARISRLGEVAATATARISKLAQVAAVASAALALPGHQAASASVNVRVAFQGEAQAAASANIALVSTYVTDITGTVDPGTDEGHYLRVRYRKDAVGGQQLDLWAHVVHGGTRIASWSVVDVAGDQWYLLESALTTGQASAITNYNDLQLELVVRHRGGSPQRRIYVSWAHLLVPPKLPIQGGQVAEQASVRILVPSEVPAAASARVALPGEVAASASARIALPGQATADASARLALPGQATADASTRIALAGQQATSATVRLAQRGQAPGAASARIGLPGATTGAATARIAARGHQAVTASARLALPGQLAATASAQLALPGQLSADATARVALPGHQAATASARVAHQAQVSEAASVRLALRGHSQAAASANIQTATPSEVTGQASVWVEVPQVAVPDGDVANDGWLNELGQGTGLYASVDEQAPPNDADWVHSPQGGG